MAPEQCSPVSARRGMKDGSTVHGGLQRAQIAPRTVETIEETTSSMLIAEVSITV